MWLASAPAVQGPACFSTTKVGPAAPFSVPRDGAGVGSFLAGSWAPPPGSAVRGGGEDGVCAPAGTAASKPEARASPRNLLLEWKDTVPVLSHVDDRPAPRLRLVEPLVESADGRLAVVGPLALGGGVVGVGTQAGAGGGGGRVAAR